jgi:hypothetical protein
MESFKNLSSRRECAFKRKLDSFAHFASVAVDLFRLGDNFLKIDKTWMAMSSVPINGLERGVRRRSIYFIYKKTASVGQTNPARFVLAPFMRCNGPTLTAVHQFNAL